MEKIWLKSYPKGIESEIHPIQEMALVDLVNTNLKRFASKVAYSCVLNGTELTKTYKEIDEDSAAFAAYLQSIGLKAGDKIALMMPNILQYPVALFGALRAGLIIVNTNPLYTSREIEHQFNDAGVTAVVIAENFAHELSKVVAKTKVKKVILTSIGGMFGGVKGWVVNTVLRFKGMVEKYSLQNTIKFGQALKIGRSKSYTTPKTGLDDMVCIQYTGGTTGVAKGAVLTNKNLLSNMYQVRAWVASGSAGIIEGEEVILTPLPMYHIFSFTVNCLCFSSFGAKSVLVPNPRDIPGLVDVMNRTQPSVMTGVNTLFNALLNDEGFRALNFAKLKYVIGGAMAIQGAVAKRWKEVTGSPLTEGYGMTEASPVVSVNPLDDPNVGTIGLPVPSTLVRIVGEDDQEVALGERGEIQVKGPQVMKGYYQRPEATANTITADGWLKTGDVGIMSGDGYVKIVDRIKDMILVSGFNVYPNEIEDVLAKHTKILEVAAVGVEDAKSGEAVKVFIVKGDQSLTEKEVRAYCTEQFTGYKKPKFVEFRTELPKTNVGKILRRALRDEEKSKVK